jgi:hypothetical protein
MPCKVVTVGVRWRNRKVNAVAKMNDVETVRPPKDQVHQPDMVGQRLAALGVAPCAFAARHQGRAGDGIATGKQRDVVALAYEFSVR